MENTLVNQAGFFANYYGVKCLRNILLNPELPAQILIRVWSEELKNQFLELKDLRDITVDELGNLARFYEQTATNVYIHDDQLTFDYYSGDETHSAAVELNSGYCLDFLRSKGYAIEWMGLSVTELIEYNWIKTK